MIKFILRFLLCFTFLSSVSAKIPEFERVFQSDVFSSYQQQLQQFVLENFPNGLQENEQAQQMFILIQEPLTEGRNFHKEILLRLRSLIQQKNELVENTEVIRFIDSLSLWMYTQPKLLTGQRQVLEEVSDLSLVKISDHNCVPFFKKFFKSLQKNVQLTHSLPHNDKPNDTHFFGSLPFRLYSIGSTQLIYTSRVTIDAGIDKISISNEFKNYLDVLKHQEKKHLYINLMKRQEHHSLEYYLTKVIEDLEESHDLHVASFDKASDFYHQKNFYEMKYLFMQNNAEIFKTDLFSQLFLSGQESYFKWPKQLDLTSWQVKAYSILDEVHQVYFSGKEYFSLDERKIFIELVYAKLIIALHEGLQPSFSNITCKQGVDRAPGTYSLLYSLIKFESQGSLSQDDRENLLVMLFSPAVSARNRPMNSSRFKKFFLPFNYLNNHYSHP